MKKIRNEMIKSFIVSGIGLFVILFILYKSITEFIIQQEIQKARLLAHTLVYTRQYLAKMAPYIEVKNTHFHPFAMTPAYAVSQIAKVIQKKEHIYVKQTSDKYRDINNKPNVYELKAIDYFKAHPNAKEFFQIHQAGKCKQHKIKQEHLFYAYPLVTKKSCLKCHGPKKEIPKPILKKLEKYYGDRAFGYKLGELRGIISIKIPFQHIKNEIDKLFFKLSLLLLFFYVLGIYLFLRINNLIMDDIEQIDDYLQNTLAKNIYKPLKKEMHFEEFNIIKNEINNTVKALKQFQKEVYESLYYNAITKLPNRRKLLKVIDKENPPIIVILDIDSFKEINYFYGEEIADKLILEVAKRLSKYKVFHIKIDEFAIILNRTLSKDEVYEFTKILIDELEKPYEIEGYSILIKFRAGISYTDRNFMAALSALDATRILNKDIAFCSEAESIRNAYKNHLVWLKKLKVAIQNDKIVPFYQPIVDVNKNICKYEVLVRLIDEDGKIVSPFFFLEVAKKSRLYFEITKKVIEKSFEKFKNLNVDFSINITTLDMESDEMKNFIIEKITAFPEPERINFEIVESEDIKDSKEAFEFIKELKSHGCKILIDDFGSGYANFDYLLSLGANGVKIDGSLIKNIIEDRNSQIIVKTIVNFAKGVNMQIVAEFVENDEIFEYLKNLGIECYQGYFFSPPKQDLI